MSLKEKLNQNVPWYVFALAIGIIASVFGYQATIDAKADAEIKGYNVDLTEIKVDISQIKTDVSWIKANLDK